MAVTKRDLIKVSELAKIDASDSLHLLDDFTRLLEHFAQISSIDLTYCPPMELPPQCKLRWRDDTLTAHLQKKDVLEGAPKTNGNFFIVPKIVGEKP